MLSTIDTCDLIAELQRRWGAACAIVEPDKEFAVKVIGPAAVLVVSSITSVKYSQ